MTKSKKKLEKYLTVFEVLMDEIDNALIPSRSKHFYSIFLDRLDKDWEKIDGLKHVVLEKDEDGFSTI